MNQSKGGIWRPRINIDVSEETYEQLQRLPHGTRKVLLDQLMISIADELRLDAARFIADVVSREVKIRDVLKMEAIDAAR